MGSFLQRDAGVFSLQFAVAPQFQGQEHWVQIDDQAQALDRLRQQPFLRVVPRRAGRRASALSMVSEISLHRRQDVLRLPLRVLDVRGAL